MRRRFAVIGLSLIVLGLLVAPGVLVGTQAGARWVAQGLEARLPLRIEGVQGSILRGLQIQRLAYRDERTSVVLDALDLSLHARCALRSTICVPRVAADRVAVEVAAPTSDRSSEIDPLAFLAVLPALEVDRLDVGVLDVAIEDVQVVLEALRLAGSASSEGLLIDDLRVCHELACGQARGELTSSGRWLVEGATEFREGVLARLVAVDGLVLPQAYRFDAQGSLREAAVLLTSPEASGLEVAARGQADAGYTVTATLAGLPLLVPQIAGNPWLALRGPLELDLRAADSVLQVGLRQNLAGYGPQEQPLAVSLRAEAGALELTRATLGEGAAVSLRASGPLGTFEALRPDLQFEFSGLDLPEAGGVPVGDLRGAADLRFDFQEPRESWSLAVRELSFEEGGRRWRSRGGLAAVTQGLFPLGELDAELRDPRLDGDGPLRVRYRRDASDGPAFLLAPRGLTLGAMNLTALDVSVTPGVGDELAVTVHSAGDLATDLAVHLAASQDGARGVLEPFRLRWKETPVRSPEPTEFAWIRAAETLRLGPFCLRLGASRGCSSGADFGPSGSLELALTLNESYEDRLGDKRFSIEARGPGLLALRWTDWKPEALSFSADLTRLALDPFIGVASAPPIVWDRAHMAGQYAAGAGQLEAELQSSTAGSLAVDLALEGGRLDGRVDAGDLLLPAFSDFIPELSMQTGRGAAALRITGTPEAPEITGTVTVREASLRVDSIDGDLEDLNLRARLDGRSVALQGEGLLGGGALGLEAVCCEGQRLRGTVIGARNRLRLPNGLDVLLSPSLDVELAPSALTVTGSLAVHEGVFEHSALEEGGVAVSPDVRRTDTPEDRPQRFELTLDLRTLIEPGFVLRSRQLESILSGDLRLIMAPRTPPSLFGNLEVLGGELRAYGQALRLTEGSLGFIGDPLNPDLAISAEREIRTENQRVGFRVRGTLEEPLFELFSDPQRSNDETLSYLLRGRGPDVGVSADGTAMALSLGASAVNQSGVLSSLNALPGLSGVSLGAEGTDQDMAATISAYVGNRLYLSYGVGIYEPVNALTARLFLRSRLWLEVVSRLENSFDLYYRFDWN